jgi:hypothetical protein
MSAGLYEYVANLHVHTRFSDGEGPVEEVIQAAREAGLDLLLINDHDTLQALPYEGYHGQVLVLVGLEFSGPHNHYLAYGLNEAPAYDWRRPQEFVDQTRAAGGIGFIAHPFEKGSPLSEGGKAFTWEDWSVKHFSGLCLWNYSSAWKSQAVNLRTALWHYALRAWTLPGPDETTLAKWDELGRERPVAGIGGSDAHAFSYRLGPLRFKIFPYGYLFRAVNTHVLLETPLARDVVRDRAAVYRALAQGRCFVAHDRLKSALGFDFRLENNNEGRAFQGDEVRLCDGDHLVWSLPVRAPARVLQNGREILSITARQGRLRVTQAGVYRLEAFWPTALFGHRPWIFSNAIYIRP